MVMKMQQMDPTANMGQVGSSVLRAIQNNSDPLIDLFIRESIQNSLDAGDKEISIPYVSIDFIVKQFNANQLHHSLDEITEILNNRFPNEYYTFVAVKDTNTTGLTGPLKRTEVRDNKYGNLQKLVYHVGKPQDQLGAGGSWGYGKTLYYRISQIGLVVYYSRIKKENGEYESRLCAVMCEDENSENAILPCDENNNKSGIAWWGDIDEKKNTYPITNETHIKEFLKIFKIEPYVNNEVGTIVIIPYINEQALLNENSIELSLDFEDEPLNAPKLSLEDELRVAIQRWYSPRLNNPQYQSHYKRYGKNVKYLKGLEDARGTLFYDYARLIQEISPKVFIYENVKGLLTHDKGRTWEIIKSIFKKLNYKIYHKVLDAQHYGLPQMRERIFVVGIRNDIEKKAIFQFPSPIQLTKTSRDYLDTDVDNKYYLGQKGFEWATSKSKNRNKTRVNRDIIGCQTANQQDNWIGDLRVEYPQQRHYNDPRIYIGEYEGHPAVARKMTPNECVRLMGFEHFKIVVNDIKMYRQAGNSIAVPVLNALIKQLLPILQL